MHVPVLLHEVVSALACAPGKKIIDATLDGGGHARAIVEQYPDVRVLGIELDPVLMAQFKREHPDVASRITLVSGSYANLAEIVLKNDFSPDAVLFDLGLSSWHYESSGRGFSFLKDEPLDMRYDPEHGQLTAAQIINTYSREQISQLLSEYGEEQFADDIAEHIVATRSERPVLTTARLVGIIEEAVPAWYRRKKIHCATKTFQALRIAVNDELGNVRLGVQAAIDVLNPGGRLAVISFHGLEDKIVREIFKKNTATGVVRWTTRRTIRPSWDEIKHNPRARSAKMKVVEKLSR